MHYTVQYILYNFQDLFDLKIFEKLRSPNIEKKWTHKRNEMFFFFISLSAEVRE